MITFIYKRIDEYDEKLQELKQQEKLLKFYNFLDKYVLNGAHIIAIVAAITNSARIGAAFSQDNYSDAPTPALILLLAIGSTFININTQKEYKEKIANIKTKIEDIKTDLAFIKSNRKNMPIIDITKQQNQQR